MELTPDNVICLVVECMYKDDELPKGGSVPDGCIVVEGLTRKFGFHPGRIEDHKSDIRSLLEQLPEEFMKDKGGGWAFQNACVNRKGELWTGLHRIMEELFVLGMACGYVKYLMPREDWEFFGGLPYLAIEFPTGDEVKEVANGTVMVEDPDMDKSG